LTLGVLAQLASEEDDAVPIPSLMPTESPAPGTTSKLTSAQYSLQAIVRHEGATAFSGHYKTNVKGVVTARMSGGDDRWRLHDDARVTVVDEATVLRECETAAYMLFYTLKDIRASP
jgi:uncharacterized UBP type Zn finger protein